eukprot:scaffold163136_cov32-Tisochrysis_lutea.AAC.2
MRHIAAASWTLGRFGGAWLRSWEFPLRRGGLDRSARSPRGRSTRSRLESRGGSQWPLPEDGVNAPAKGEQDTSSRSSAEAGERMAGAALSSSNIAPHRAAMSAIERCLPIMSAENSRSRMMVGSNGAVVPLDGTLFACTRIAESDAQVVIIAGDEVSTFKSEL